MYARFLSDRHLESEPDKTYIAKYIHIDYRVMRTLGKANKVLHMKTADALRREKQKTKLKRNSDIDVAHVAFVCFKWYVWMYMYRSIHFSLSACSSSPFRLFYRVITRSRCCSLEQFTNGIQIRNEWYEERKKKEKTKHTYHTIHKSEQFSLDEGKNMPEPYRNVNGFFFCSITSVESVWKAPHKTRHCSVSWLLPTHLLTFCVMMRYDFLWFFIVHKHHTYIQLP